ncbi:WD repeat-containing protein 46 [Syngnathus acus]|uniref:WD repeat-containing protein 46 n=1 Tax=Syngnathus acus TaxID=161584 RepID=UPI0018861B0D|nr:WD repeat-containing protein 46 [Syngnathus acus]
MERVRLGHHHGSDVTKINLGVEHTTKMAAPVEPVATGSHVPKTKKPTVRYWHEKIDKNDDGKQAADAQPQNLKRKSAKQRKERTDDGKQAAPAQRQNREIRSATKRKKPNYNGQRKRFISRKEDPFPGPASIPEARIKKFIRKGKTNERVIKNNRKMKNAVARSNKVSKMAQTQAARLDLLLPEEAGFLEGDEDEDTCTISQQDIAECVDITSATKYFDLNLSQFGPYQMDYSKNGRHLLLGGRRGHIACVDWQSKQLMCEINVMESIRDVRWLHTEHMFAVAQKKWLYIYDSNGIELHCIRRFNDVLRMQFLPYHFLLATASATGFLQYLDVSVGKEVATICTKKGRLDVMCQNPHNAVIHLGHSNGTVSLWAPSQKEPLAKMLCHQAGVRSVAVDKTGTYMVTSGMDKKLKVFDVRTFKLLKSYFIPAGASCLSLSQRGLLSAATGDVVQLYRDVWSSPVTKPYMAHRAQAPVCELRFCPFEDVLGIGHGQGFTSMLVPGAAEPNFDALDSNPFRSVKQRQEWEVKALLEKIRPELISLDPTQLGKVDLGTFQQRHQDRVLALGFDPLAREKFAPRYKKKGRSSAGNVERRKRQVANIDQRDLIVKGMEDKMMLEQKRRAKEKTFAAIASQKSALGRFQK